MSEQSDHLTRRRICEKIAEAVGALDPALRTKLLDAALDAGADRPPFTIEELVAHINGAHHDECEWAQGFYDVANEGGRAFMTEVTTGVEIFIPNFNTKNLYGESLLRVCTHTCLFLDTIHNYTYTYI
jgi:hypothetical protein